MFRNNIRLLRQVRCLNQRELAEATHTPQSLICAVELGKIQPWPSLVNRLSQALGTSPEELFPSVEFGSEPNVHGKACEK